MFQIHPIKKTVEICIGEVTRGALYRAGPSLSLAFNYLILHILLLFRRFTFVRARHSRRFSAVCERERNYLLKLAVFLSPAS
jgi:hypothetical protein